MVRPDISTMSEKLIGKMVTTTLEKMEWKPIPISEVIRKFRTS